MKRNEKVTDICGLSFPVLGVRGKAFAGDEATFGDSIFAICQRPFEGQTVDDKMDAFEVMKKLRLPCNSVPLSESEIAVIKKAISKTAPPEYCGVIHDLLDAGGILPEKTHPENVAPTPNGSDGA